MSTVACERNLPLKVEKQGIVSILGSNTQAAKPPAAASFRRTLSADMSSKKWLADNGLIKHPVMKRVTSSAQLSFISAIDHHSSSSEGEEVEFYGKTSNQIPKQDDVWSSIVSQKKTEELPPPYVHPLLKKSSSSLCSKSLEICTESLGSETGSDKVTLCEPLETDSEVNAYGKVLELLQPLAQQEKERSQGPFFGKTPAIGKYGNSTASNKKMQSKSFPPPIPYLAGSSERPSLHMHSHRENGRLVLEAISVPSTKKLQAHRQDGRLRLTLIQPPTTQQHAQQPDRDKAVIFDTEGYKIEDNFEDVFDMLGPEDDEIDVRRDDETTEEIEEELNESQETVMVHAVPEKVRGVINIHRSALLMKKTMGLENQIPKWSPKFNHGAVEVETKHEDEKKTTLPQSLPPRPRTTRSMPTRPPPAASFNAYEYFWRPKPATTGLKSPPIHCSALKNNTDNNILATNKPKSYGQQELLVLRNCKKARRSLLSWDAYCIATT
ncbi:protein FAF-like, chloroplastic [Apium graveolens]|uniref:protein FAF-like, chloroplastic n=1 Tax=Apium graveolens TaxID=4045 RepID=UPI003D7BE870